MRDMGLPPLAIGENLDNGALGGGSDYSPTFCAAFVIDCEGNHIEAVCHAE